MELLESNIKSKESELESLLPQYQHHKGQEERLNARLKACEQHRSELFAKEGRVQEFSSTEERDRFINKEIMSLQQSAANKEKQVLNYTYTFIKNIMSLNLSLSFVSSDSRDQTGCVSIKS